MATHAATTLGMLVVTCVESSLGLGWVSQAPSTNRFYARAPPPGETANPPVGGTVSLTHSLTHTH